MCAAIPDSSATTPSSGSSTTSAKTASTPRTRPPLRTGNANAARNRQRRATSADRPLGVVSTSRIQRICPSRQAAPARPTPRLSCSGTGRSASTSGAVHRATGRSTSAPSSTSHSSACGQLRLAATAASTRGPASCTVSASASAEVTASSAARNRSTRRWAVTSCSVMTAPAISPPVPGIACPSTENARRRRSRPMRSSSTSRTRSPRSARSSGMSSGGNGCPSASYGISSRAQVSTRPSAGGSPDSARTAAFSRVTRPSPSQAITPTLRLSSTASRKPRCRSTSCRASCLATRAAHAWAAWSRARISSAVHTRGR